MVKTRTKEHDCDASTEETEERKSILDYEPEQDTARANSDCFSIEFDLG